jgi:glycerophosphoryl diester phosphodiesterase
LTHVIGHRGAPLVAQENTIDAFRAAVALGADGVEFDVRRTSGPKLAICHDEHLADGRALRGLGDDWPPALCDLPAALDACAGLAVVNVEIKNWPADGDYDESLGIADAVAEALTARPAAERARFLVSCFHLPTVDRVRVVAPELATAWLTLGFADVAADLGRVALRGHSAVHPHHSALDAGVIERARAEGLAVNPWTCDVPDRIRWLADLGVDGVVTNDVAGALAALGRSVVPGGPHCASGTPEPV